MGRLVGQIVGTARGRIGNLVTKSVKKGESIVYPYNPNRKKTNSPKAIAHNNRFKIINKFSSAVNGSLVLRRIWQLNKSLKGRSAYTKIHSYNYKRSNSLFMGKRAAIVPFCIAIDLTEFAIINDEISVTIIPDNELITPFNLPFIAVCMLNLNTPVRNRKGRSVVANDKYIRIEQEFFTMHLSEKVPAIIKFKQYPGKFKILDEYKRVRVFFTIVFNTPNDEKLWISCNSLLHKGAELDREYDEYSKNKIAEENRIQNLPKEEYSSFTLL